MPNKSDYYHTMDPVTLAPKIVNPWRNPMKTGIVTPVYDPTAVTAYTYGMSFDFARAANPGTSFTWTSDNGAIGNVAGAHHFAGNRWDVTPGTRTITALDVWCGYIRDANASALYVEVWREDDTAYTLVGTSGLISPQVGSNGAEYTTLTLASPIAITTVAGKNYFVGLRVVRTNASSATPTFFATTGLTFAYNHLRFAVDAATWNGATVSKTDSAGHLYTYTATSGILQKITYTTDRLIEQDRATLEAKSYWLAKAVSSPYISKLEGVVVADTQKLTAVLNDINGSGVTTARCTAVLDMGNTTPSTNVMTYWAVNVSLPTITQNSIAYNQAGCTFDMWFGERPASAGREDLYWQNRTLEMAIHAHAVAYTAARGTLRSSSVKGCILTLSGTFTASKLRVGTKPIVLIGDSQTINGYFNTTRTPNTDAWGGLPTALTKERLWIIGGQAGGYVATVGSQPGLKLGLIKSATPGVADGVEMSGTYTLGCTWFFAGMGVNDAIGTTSLISDAQARMRAADLVSLVAAALEEVAQYGDEIILAGLPPTSKSGTADQYDGKAVRWFNRGLLGLSLSLKCVFYNPWPDTVTPGTEGDSLPTFLEAYTSDSGTHYSAAGGSFVRGKLKSAIEAATVDLRDAWD